MIRTTAATTTALALAAALTACGGGGSSSGGSTAVTSTGVITGFGSVFVNGNRYDTSGAVIEFEDEGRRDEDDLRLGMKVRVRGVVEGGERRALRIDFDDDFKGPARDVSPNADNPAIGTFTVLGQQVTVDENTVFDDDVGDTNGDGSIDIQDLDTDEGQVVVEVSGFPTDDGILATRIDRVNAGAGDFGDPDEDDDEFEIKGFVGSVADDGSSFVINDTTFLVDGATQFEDGLAPNQDLVGVFVEVEADVTDAGDFLAREVEREDDFDDDDEEGEFEIEGVLQAVDTDSDPNTFTINGIIVPVVDAGPLADLVGSRVEIEGVFNADGVLVLEKSKPEVENSVRTEDRVASVGATSFTTRLGLEITPTGTSRVRFDDDDDDRPGQGRGPSDRVTPEDFLARLQIDDEIEARGFPNPDGSVTWTRIEREDRDDDDNDDRECELRGPVESIDGEAFTFVIQGVTIFTDAADEFEGRNDDDNLGQAGFFAQLAEGDVVKAESDEAGTGCQPGELTAQKVEFEDDDGVFGTVPRDDDDSDEDDDSDDNSDDDNGGDDDGTDG